MKEVIILILSLIVIAAVLTCGFEGDEPVAKRDDCTLTIGDDNDAVVLYEEPNEPEYAIEIVWAEPKAACEARKVIEK